MELITLIVSSLYVVGLFVLGLIALTIIVALRGGVEGGFRLFLLGLGLLGIAIAIGVILLYSPDWLAITLMLMVAFIPWMFMLRYLVNTQRSGDLLMALLSKHETWSRSIRDGAGFVLLGLFILIFSDPLTPPKSYALSVLCISLGFFGAIRRIRHSQIRAKGIVYEWGNFYRWENIESYVWKFGEDKLTLELKNSDFKRTVHLKIPSQFRHEVVGYLSQHVSSKGNNASGYVPIQKAG